MLVGFSPQTKVTNRVPISSPSRVSGCRRTTLRSAPVPTKVQRWKDANWPPVEGRTPGGADTASTSGDGNGVSIVFNRVRCTSILVRTRNSSHGGIRIERSNSSISPPMSTV